MMQRVKSMTTGFKITAKSNWLKFLESDAEESNTAQRVYDEELQLLHVDPGRCVVFRGTWYAPGITIRPVVEFWNHKALTFDEPESRNSLLSPQSLYVAAGLAGLGGLAAHHAVKRFQASPSDHAVRLYPERTSVDANQALALAPVSNSAPVGLAAVPSLFGYSRAPAIANLTTKQKLKSYLRTRSRHIMCLTLEEFLTCLGLKGCLVKLQGISLTDLKMMSEKELAGLDIEIDDIVKMKNGIRYLMDLHDKSFFFAEVPTDPA